MITGINHVGIVVKSIDETLELLGKMMEVKVVQRAVLKEAGQESCIVQFGNSCYELMEPYGDKGVVADFLKKTGGGFHHISLSSDDFDADVAHFEEGGIKVIGVTELQGLKFAFTHPKTSGGILYELCGPAV